jgi:hypothetical protein
MLATAEKWRFVREPLVQSSLLSRGIGGFTIAFSICWVGIWIAVAALERPNFKPMLGVLALVGSSFLLGVILIRRPIQRWSAHQRLQKRGEAATAKVLSKETDRWRSAWGDWEEFVVLIEVTCGKDQFEMRSRVNGDAYLHAEVGKEFPIVIDYEKRRWAWQREAPSE